MGPVKKIPNNCYNSIRRTQGLFFEKISHISAKKITDDLLNFSKPKEQLDILKRHITGQRLEDKKLLEIGSGLGIFHVVARIDYNIDAWGIEPESDGFDSSYEISLDIIKSNNLSTDKIIYGYGENLPFPDQIFDVVYSTNVLEHVKDPEKVIQEAIRVCKRGGIIQIVAPNYGSFFDGHYACFYAPYQPKWFWKLWIKFVLKRDPSFADTLNTNINYFTINRWIRNHIQNRKIEVISCGEEVFKERMMTGIFSDWAGLGKVKRWVNIIKKIKLTLPLVYILLRLKAYSPIILTIRKN